MQRTFIVIAKNHQSGIDLGLDKTLVFVDLGIRYFTAVINVLLLLQAEASPYIENKNKMWVLKVNVTSKNILSILYNVNFY